MQWKWKRIVVEQVLLTATRISLTALEIVDVVRRHWGKGQAQPQKDDHERDEG